MQTLIYATESNKFISTVKIIRLQILGIQTIYHHPYIFLGNQILIDVSRYRDRRKVKFSSKFYGRIDAF